MLILFIDLLMNGRNVCDDERRVVHCTIRNIIEQEHLRCMSSIKDAILLNHNICTKK